MDCRSADPLTQQRELIDRLMLGLNTAMPGVIDAFDEDTQTATVLPAIQMKTNIDGEVNYIDLPPILNVPVLFPFVSTAGFALTFPVKRGDNCLLIFSQRGIDNWHASGGVQPPEEGVGVRHHDLTDAFAIFAPSPLTETLGSWETEGIELRNREKNSRITLKDATIEVQRGATQLTITDTGVDVTTTDVNVTATNSVIVTSPTTTLDGDLEVTGSVTNGGVNIGNTHVHPQGVDSGGDTQQNTGVPQ